ncbi:MAG: ShlB/FhaC/HecB family hemolysin secretion/activation protein [Acidobacteria bacterium]|nr:ShlB/FhaC/HecB family hemolysin secretion/activation protein [Acidobacteriota bacterium]
MRVCAFVLLLLAAAGPAIAQSPIRGMAESAGRNRPQLPDFEPPERTAGTVLPRTVPPAAPALESLFPEIRIFVRRVRVVGNTVLPQKQIDAIISQYEGASLSFADLERLREQLSEAYKEAHYISSGAVIPDQKVQDGVVEIRIIEGKLLDPEVVTDGRLKRNYLDRRLRLRKSRIVNVMEIEEALEVLRRNQRIRSLRAELVPGDERGESRLRLEVEEHRAHSESLQINNYQPVSVGSAGGEAMFQHINLTGFGDTFAVSFRGTHGLRSLDATYAVPLNGADTMLSLHSYVARSEVVQEPFAPLDIKSSMESYGITLSHPVRRTRNSEFAMLVSGEIRRSQSYLLGSGFRFTDDLTEDGVARVSVIRFGQTWTRSGIGQAIAARSFFTLGLDCFGATHPAGSSDARFLAWLGQVQWAHRVRALGSGAQVIVRGDAQFSDSPLPGLEKFALGGRETVRGYHENELVRDNGMIGSAEVRIPFLKIGEQALVLEAAPFVDVGRSWNTDRPTEPAETLPSAGAGLRLRNRNRLQAEIYWGYAFRDVPNVGKWNLQDSGVHIGLVWSLP